ncbi:MAG: hypothetical protein JW915_18810 [Chitinispirillaceae bacterium]|nr:hypothetical protein [Chitinispirillaceae bacterium]
MPSHKNIEVKSLCLDLDNYRTIHQRNETFAVNSMISISPNRFWGLFESLLKDGYHATENILILDDGEKLIVKEGNRRVAVLKIILGYIKNVEIHSSILDKIKLIPDEWKSTNQSVPCIIYKPSQQNDIDRIIALTHAKGERAGRDDWNAVATARFNRDKKEHSEPGLDLLEKWFKSGKNLNQEQVSRWSGDYHLTVLNEALSKLYMHVGAESVIELVNSYPKKNKDILDQMLFDIGLETLDFKTIRDKNKFFGIRYGVSPITTSTNISNPTTQSLTLLPSGTSNVPTSGTLAMAGITVNTHTTPTCNSATVVPKKTKAVSADDPKFIKRKLRMFTPKGNNREKLKLLQNEIIKISIIDCPHAFSFLLRSMFEISCKAYCTDHTNTGGPKLSAPNGRDKNLVDILREITNHLTKNATDKEKLKVLHGAMTELGKKEGLLSVTSLNQLVHNPKFSILTGDICLLFGNIFPLLEEMNK